MELDVRRLVTMRDRDRAAYLTSTAGDASVALSGGDVLLLTSRELMRTEDRATSLRIAKQVSAGVCDVVSRIRAATPPAWVVTKGGITSHEVATTGLGIRRARVVGQLFPGLVSVMRPTVAPPEIVGMPWVVFAGNVGDADTLGQVVRMISGIGR